MLKDTTVLASAKVSFSDVQTNVVRRREVAPTGAFCRAFLIPAGLHLPHEPPQDTSANMRKRMSH